MSRGATTLDYVILVVTWLLKQGSYVISDPKYRVEFLTNSCMCKHKSPNLDRQFENNFYGPCKIRITDLQHRGHFSL